MLSRSDELFQRVQQGDPLHGGRPAFDADALLTRILAQAEHVERSRFAPRWRVVAIVAVLAAALLVPAAVALHRQLLTMQEITSDPPSPDQLAGTWNATVANLHPTTLNGRWTIVFGHADPHAYGNQSSYTLRRNGRLVASGWWGLSYQQLGPIINLHDGSGPGRCDDRTGAWYFVHVAKRTLTLVPTPVRDNCVRRRVVLASRPFQR